MDKRLVKNNNKQITKETLNNNNKDIMEVMEFKISFKDHNQIKNIPRIKNNNGKIKTSTCQKK